MKKNIKIIIIITIAIIAIISMIVAGIIMNKENKILEDTLISINREELQEKIENKDNFILVFTSTTCGSCQTYKPKLQRVLEENNLVAYEVISQEFTNEDDIAYLNSIATISGTPTTVFIENGEEKSTSYRIVGDQTTTNIIEKLEKVGYIE